MDTTHAYTLIRRLFTVIGMFAWQDHTIATEVRFLRVMYLKWPEFNWANIMRGIREHEA